MKKQFIILLALLAVFIFFSPSICKADSLTERVKGRILLQVEEHGEAWYVRPSSGERYYMANGDEAYNIMRELGVGITNKDLERIKKDKSFAKKHSGKIFLQVEAHGEAFYIDSDGIAHYLKNGEEAYSIMRDLGLGITNNDLNQIEINKKYQEQSTTKEESELNVNKDKEDLSTQENDVASIKDADAFVNKNIESAKRLIDSFYKLKNSNLEFISDTESDMTKYKDAYLVQSSGQQLVNEVKSSNYIIDRQIEICNKMLQELYGLIGTGNSTSSVYQNLENQLVSNMEQYKLSDAKSKDLIETHVSNIAGALNNQINEANVENKRMQKATNALNELKAYIDSTDIKLTQLLNNLDALSVEMQSIKNQTIPMNIINNKLIQPTNEYNSKVNEYNSLLEVRKDLVRLYNVVLDYGKNSIPIPSSDNQRLKSLGIYL